MFQRFTPLEGAGHGLNRNKHADVHGRQGTGSSSVRLCLLIKPLLIFGETDQWGEGEFSLMLSSWVMKDSDKRQQSPHCFTRRHTEHYNPETGLYFNILIDGCESSSDAWHKHGKVREAVAGVVAPHQNSPSSLRLNSIECVKRFRYHGGLLEIDPHMCRVEAGCYCAIACLLIWWSLQSWCSRLSRCIFILNLAVSSCFCNWNPFFWVQSCFFGWITGVFVLQPVMLKYDNTMITLLLSHSVNKTLKCLIITKLCF